MQTANIDATVFERLLAKDAIRDVLATYSVGMDRRDAEIVKTVFWPDAYLDYGNYQGPSEKWAPYVIEWFQTGKMKITTHMTANSLIRVDGDAGAAETYFHAMHSSPILGEYRNIMISGRYHDKFERRQGTWRISERIVNYDWFTDCGVTRSWDVGCFGVHQESAKIGSPEGGAWSCLSLKGAGSH